MEAGNLHPNDGRKRKTKSMMAFQVSGLLVDFPVKEGQDIQLADCTLTAPFDGVIAQRFVEQDQSVRAKEFRAEFGGLRGEKTRQFNEEIERRLSIANGLR